METNARLTFLAAPNSPSGTVYTEAQIRTLAGSLKNGLLVIDEAYAEFAGGNHLRLALELENVVVLRTFSKSHSLAGMRLGLLVASRRIVEGLWKVKDSYNLDRLAIAAGAASLRDTAWAAREYARARARHARASGCGADGAGFRDDSHAANFIFARLPSAELAAGAYRFLKSATFSCATFRRGCWTMACASALEPMRKSRL